MKKPGPNDEFPEMIYPIYAVQDVLSGFAPPAIMLNDKFARREFFNFVKGNDNGNDYRLFKIGYFNGEKGTIEPICPIEQVASGSELMVNEDEK